MTSVIGREDQVRRLQKALSSGKSELVCLYGRRRVGKTFLVRETYAKNIVFELSGIFGGTYREQLNNFYYEITKRSKKLSKKPVPADWFSAFNMLGEYVSSIKTTRKKVIFIDEFPWLHTHKSRFVSMFGHFWNSYCSKRRDIVVVICGSSASFMVKKVINDRGGLHNRISALIRLLPFNLYETEKFLRSRKVYFDRYDMLRLYMTLGGIPHYLEKVYPDDSVATAIDRLLGNKRGELINEFELVFTSLFEESQNHRAIVACLAKSKAGITREELAEKSGIASGGTLSNAINELKESGFISEYPPFESKKKNTLFRLSDEFSLFYLKFVDANAQRNWKTFFSSRNYVAWSGFAFETLCMKHIAQVKMGLGISGIDTVCSSWRNDAAQIDLLIDRSDRCINICEMKFSEKEFVITKRDALNIKKKRSELSRSVASRKNMFITLITTFGVKENEHSRSVMTNQLLMDVLFEKE